MDSEDERGAVLSTAERIQIRRIRRTEKQRIRRAARTTERIMAEQAQDRLRRRVHRLEISHPWTAETRQRATELRRQYRAAKFYD